MSNGKKQYYDHVIEAYQAAQELSKTVIYAVYIEEDLNGFYLSQFGTVGNSAYYVNGMHSSEIDWD